MLENCPNLPVAQIIRNNAIFVIIIFFASVSQSSNRSNTIVVVAVISDDFLFYANSPNFLSSFYVTPVHCLTFVAGFAQHFVG